MRLDRWIEKQRRENPAGISLEQMDRWFVAMVRTMENAVRAGEDGPEGYVYGKVSADSFSIDENGILSFGAGNACVDYSPADERQTMASDLFALGLVFWEMLIEKSLAQEEGLCPGLPMDWEELKENAMDEGRTSLVRAEDIPGKYAAFAGLLEEMTQIEPEERYASFQDFPNGEYKILFVDEKTGKELIPPKKILISEVGDSFFVDPVLTVGEKQYFLKQGSPSCLDYSFLRKVCRAEYSESGGEEEVFPDW